MKALCCEVCFCSFQTSLSALAFLIYFAVLCKVHPVNKGNTWSWAHLFLAPAAVGCAWTQRQIWLCFAVVVMWEAPLPWQGVFWPAGLCFALLTARESLCLFQEEGARTRLGLSPSLTMLASTRCLRRRCPKCWRTWPQCQGMGLPLCLGGTARGLPGLGTAPCGAAALRRMQVSRWAVLCARHCRGRSGHHPCDCQLQCVTHVGINFLINNKLSSSFGMCHHLNMPCHCKAIFWRVQIESHYCGEREMKPEEEAN